MSNIFRKLVTFAAIIAAVAVGGLLTSAAPASAATAQPKSGWVAITVDQASDSVTPLTTTSPGGGLWTYGTYVDSFGWKHCYSRYLHPSKLHSATAKLNGGTSKVYADANLWASADTKAGLAYTCYAYWNTY